ncbi:MAG: M4 family metallopeptidase [Aphanothece sp. CMT-3BRIN-NPC111]|jgi:Zn-dependent metalloprotease|nr:M4 family metallopeptidase [Aphanothece sp. CMT-3BRIN-NPC111]
MKNFKQSLRKPSLLLTAFLLSFQSGALANPNAIAALQSSGAIVGKDNKTGKVNLVGSNGPNGLKLPGNFPSQPGNPQAQAMNFAKAYAPLFGVKNAATDLVAKKSLKINGESIVKYQQVYKGIPVVGGQINVNLDKSGNLLAITGEAADNLNIDTTAKVSAAQARNTSLKLVQKYYKLGASSVKVSTPQLHIYKPGIIDPGDAQSPGKLVWFVKVTPIKSQPLEQIVLVDAQAKDKVVLTFNNIPDARNRQTYTANGTSNLPGTLVCTETNTTTNCTAAGTSDTAKAHTYAADTYNFFLSNFGRDSLDGFGLPLVSTVRYSPDGFPYENAYWDGNQMVYGDGLAKADDVVGHELAHGLTQYTSNLFYYYQSGAINESMSDVFGEFVDLTNAKGNDTAAVRWKLGEDLPASIGVIRDMKDPTLFGNPDKMTSPHYYKGTEDGGGVHFNSGVNNKAAYLMVDGGTFNGKTITALGIPKVAKIYYKAQTTYLTSGSNYIDLYNYLYQSCTSQIGIAGITAANCTQVKNALDAVEMNLQPVAGFQPQASVCPVGKNPVNAFFDDVEGSSKWNFLTLKGYNPWKIETGYAASGTNLLYVEDVDSLSDSVAVMKTGVTIPAGAFLHFKHAFGFEFDSTNNYDGAIVEYSIGSTGVWQDAKALFVEGQNYNGTIFNGSGADNPLKGRTGFTKESHGYVSSRYNLATLAGKVVRFRFRQANDNSVGSLGWVQDDVRIYTCP